MSKGKSKVEKTTEQRKYNLYMVGLSGKKYVGKTTMAGMLKKEYEEVFDIHILSFGRHLKECVKLIFNLKDEDVYTQEGKERIVAGADLTVVQILQKFGTDFIREIYPDLWVDFIRSKVCEIMEDPCDNTLIIIDDVRFPNECNFVREYGFLMHLERDHELSVKEEISNHKSENSINKRWNETTLFLPNDYAVASSMVDAVFKGNMFLKYKMEI